MLTDKQKQAIKSLCLQNAVFYEGKARPEAVLGKVMANHPEMRKTLDDVRKGIEACIKTVNRLSLEQQKAELAKASPDMLTRVEKPTELLGQLPGAVEGKFATRFAPAPTGALHISHLLRAAFLSWLYAKKYKGKFILRFEDTDATKVKPEFYEWIKQDLAAVGIKPDEFYVQSQRLELYYKFALDMIKKGKAYVCKCPAEKFRELKDAKRNCPDRSNSSEKNVAEWKAMLDGKYEEGQVVVRLKTSMTARNPVLRDPPLLRIEKTLHPYTKTKHSVWPLYNFACVIDDHLLGITHVFRAKEHEHNTAVQAKVYAALGWKPPVTVNFGMVHLSGISLHKRNIREGIKAGLYTGWDDIRLPTARALLRRGYQPKAFEELALHTGLTKTDIKLDWENLDGINRKIVDPIANRYSAVVEPVKISVKDLNLKNVKQKLHPDFPERGERTIPVDKNEIYIQKEDWQVLKGKEFRLIGLCNLKLKGDLGVITGKEIIKGMPKIQWVSKPNLKIKIIKPEQTLSGLGEPDMARLKVGDIIQLERIGFGRIENIGKEITFVWAHK